VGVVDFDVAAQLACTYNRHRCAFTVPPPAPGRYRVTAHTWDRNGVRSDGPEIIVIVT
jgi:hypothetical protein